MAGQVCVCVCMVYFVQYVSQKSVSTFFNLNRNFAQKYKSTTHRAHTSALSFARLFGYRLHPPCVRSLCPLRALCLGGFPFVLLC